MNLTCEDLVDLMLDFVGEELPDEQVVAIKAHLCGCRPCVASVEAYRLTIRVTRALPKCGPLPPALEERLRAALKAEGLG